MEKTVEQQVLSMITATPGITVRQIHALRPAIKPVNNAIQMLVRKGKIQGKEGKGRRNTEYYAVQDNVMHMAQDDNESEGIAALRKERERYDSSKQRVNEIWSKAYESLLEMLNGNDPDEMSGRLQQFNELMTEYAQAAKFVRSREDIFG